jgi:DNA-binding NtrC family response regulator
MALRRNKGSYSGKERRAPAKVMVVSDDDGARELLMRVIDKAGFDGAGAATIEDAMTGAHGDLPRCVVLDMRTGGIGSNLKLLDMIRGSDDHRISSARAVIIADNPRNRAFSFQSGTDAFVVRPYRADQLVEQIANVLEVADNDRARHRRDELDRHGDLHGDVIPGSNPVWEARPGG